MGALRNFTNSSMAIANDYSAVINIREEVYKKKLEIIKTPMVREIVEATFLDGVLPRTIMINRECIIARVYDAESITYHPNGIVVYTPEVTFDYYFAYALFTIFQDLYPNVYEINKITTSELAEALQLGTWQGVLTMNEEFLFKNINPSFDITNIANTPIEALPLKLEDDYTKNKSGIAKASLVLGIISCVGGILTTGSLFGVPFGLVAGAGIITGLIAVFTSGKDKKKKKKAIWGIVLSIASFIVPLILGIILAMVAWNGFFG